MRCAPYINFGESPKAIKTESAEVVLRGMLYLYHVAVLYHIFLPLRAQ